jgi:hypothetical protein
MFGAWAIEGASDAGATRAIEKLSKLHALALRYDAHLRAASDRSLFALVDAETGSLRSMRALFSRLRAEAEKVAREIRDAPKLKIGEDDRAAEHAAEHLAFVRSAVDAHAPYYSHAMQQFAEKRPWGSGAPADFGAVRAYLGELDARAFGYGQRAAMVRAARSELGPFEAGDDGFEELFEALPPAGETLEEEIVRLTRELAAAEVKVAKATKTELEANVAIVAEEEKGTTEDDELLVALVEKHDNLTLALDDAVRDRIAIEDALREAERERQKTEDLASAEREERNRQAKEDALRSAKEERQRKKAAAQSKVTEALRQIEQSLANVLDAAGGSTGI